MTNTDTTSPFTISGLAQCTENQMPIWATDNSTRTLTAANCLPNNCDAGFLNKPYFGCKREKCDAREINDNGEPTNSAAPPIRPIDPYEGFNAETDPNVTLDSSQKYEVIKSSPYHRCIIESCTGVDKPYKGCIPQPCASTQGSDSGADPYVGCICSTKEQVEDPGNLNCEPAMCLSARRDGYMADDGSKIESCTGPDNECVPYEGCDTTVLYNKDGSTARQAQPGGLDPYNNSTCEESNLAQTDTCPEGVDEAQTAVELCEQIDETKDTLGGVANNLIDKAGDFFNNLTPGGWIDAAGSDASMTSLIKNNFNIDINNDTIVNVKNACNSTSAQVAENILQVDGTECTRLKNKALKNCTDASQAYSIAVASSENAIDLIDQYSESIYKPCVAALDDYLPKVEGVNQSINQQVRQTCLVEAVAEAVRQQNASIDSEAMAEMMTEADGFSADAENKSTLCQNINQNVSSCTLLNTSNCCSNMSTQKAKNRFEANCGTFNDIKQEVNQKAYQQCMMGSKVANAEFLDLESESKSSLISTVLSYGPSIGIGFAALIIMGIIYYAYQYSWGIDETDTCKARHTWFSGLDKKGCNKKLKSKLSNPPVANAVPVQGGRRVR